MTHGSRDLKDYASAKSLQRSEIEPNGVFKSAKPVQEADRWRSFTARDGSPLQDDVR
jgi:hypothetical protein